MSMSSDVPERSGELLDRQRSRLILVDLQDKLLPAIPSADAIVETARFLAEAARAFDIPVMVSEQYPQGLGSTTAVLAGYAAERPAKLRFSAAEALRFPALSDATDHRDQLVLAGLETHVCILQTTFDLMALGYRVSVVVDGVGSRRSLDHEVALGRIRDGGATLISAESVVFEWCETAADPQFRALSTLVKARANAAGA